MKSAPTVKFYSTQPGETHKVAKDRWIYAQVQALSRKLNQRKGPGNDYILAVQDICRFFTDNEVYTFFHEAPGTFNFLPKPAEVKTGLWEIKKAIDKNKPAPAHRPIEQAPTFPWPNYIIGLLMGFEDARGVSPFGLGQTGITYDEAQYLYDTWKKGDWENEWALEILTKSKRVTFGSIVAAKTIEPVQV